MSTRIEQTLTKLFERHRIVFWYDAKRELREAFDTVELPAIAKVEIANNEFGLKYHILEEHKNERFLLYHHGPRPADLDNWLLDVLLAHGEFRADQGALWLAELELEPHFLPVVEAHGEFFQAAKRREDLKKHINPSDTATTLRFKLLAVCAKSEPQLDAVLENLLAEHSAARSEMWKLIERCKLDSVLWKQLELEFGYRSESPSVQDFVIALFKSCYAHGTGQAAALTGNPLVFLKRWKDSRQHQEVFESISDHCAELLGIDADLSKRDFRTLLGADHFRLIDRKIIKELVRGLVSQTLSRNDVVNWVRQRRTTHWYSEYRHLYQALEFAALFLQAREEATFTLPSMADGFQGYTQNWFRLDQYYRKFQFHAVSSGQVSLLGELSDQIEGLYVNNYLMTLADRWQACVDATPQWSVFPHREQRNFFTRHVVPFVEKDVKVCVIISDALRYEIAEELQGRIQQEDRFEANLSAMLSVLPSYTQLGMAALLPHQTLAISEQAGGTVLADGLPTQGTANRNKILELQPDVRGRAMKFDDVMNLDRDASRELVKEIDVLYVYHNQIDATGDKRDTEARVFEAVEDTLDKVVLLTKKLTNANFTHLLVTADHGFLFQQRELEESDFADIDVQGNPVLGRNRRFVLGKNLKPQPGLKHYRPADLNLTGEVEVQIPKSVNRLRVQGAGSRFVHGGATLQEVVVPVLHITKKRQSTTSQVEVDILRRASNSITTGQLAVTLFQKQPASDKVLARKLRAGLYDASGNLISDQHELIFDLASDNPREREVAVRLMLTSKADGANGQDVHLRLEERLPDTTHYKTYKFVTYTMRKSFSPDFDF